MLLVLPSVCLAQQATRCAVVTSPRTLSVGPDLARSDVPRIASLHDGDLLLRDPTYLVRGGEPLLALIRGDTSLPRYAGLWVPVSGDPRPVPHPTGHRHMLAPAVIATSENSAHVMWGSSDSLSAWDLMQPDSLWQARWSEQGWSGIEAIGPRGNLHWTDFTLRSPVASPLLAVSAVWDSIVIFAASAGRLSRRSAYVGGLPSAPSATRVAGTMIVAFVSVGRSLRRRSGVNVVRSLDDGQTWSPPLEVFGTHVTVQSVDLIPLGGTRVLAIWSVPDYEGTYARTIMGSESPDAGASWQPPSAFSALEPFAGLSVAADAHGTVTVAAGGLGTPLTLARWHAGGWIWGSSLADTTESRPVLSAGANRLTLVWAQKTGAGGDSEHALRLAVNPTLNCASSSRY